MVEPELNPDLGQPTFLQLFNTALLLYDSDGFVPRACEMFCKEKNVTRDDVLREAHRSAAWDIEARSLLLTIPNIVMLLPSLATASP